MKRRQSADSKDLALAVNYRWLTRSISELILLNGQEAPPLESMKSNNREIRAFARGFVAESFKNGLNETHIESGKLRSCFMMAPGELAPGLSIYFGVIETDRSKKSDEWLLEKLKVRNPLVSETSMIILPHYLKHLLPLLYRYGY